MWVSATCLRFEMHGRAVHNYIDRHLKLGWYRYVQCGYLRFLSVLLVANYCFLSASICYLV